MISNFRTENKLVLQVLGNVFRNFYEKSMETPMCSDFYLQLLIFAFALAFETNLFWLHFFPILSAGEFPVSFFVAARKI